DSNLQLRDDGDDDALSVYARERRGPEQCDADSCQHTATGEGTVARPSRKRTASPVPAAAAPPPGLPQPREPGKSAKRAGHRHLLTLYGSLAAASPASGGHEKRA